MKIIKRTYKVAGMDCVSCAALLEMDLEDLGINAKCSYPKQTLNVEFDPKNTNEDMIKKVAKSSGYSLS
ncbi:MAG: hypothetical protein ACD_52C00323G0002 [uncultured bacterium]|uniref:HMA domain-containing protein n=1 Tax=Candidatus Woesebacteria bacterium RIFCSPHIGHO2_12_FULL_41_24 TaxID=1802510 RepID=A0A1F8AUS6_9BACT|nr:MAG: hypothetical protein ACD_52C00323G0002 [uncultured bacterium]OGM14832.1 MAG: hypothetical protein A2W15_00640 [Candidatus Woesebacteria bacterium RBG_16_41_13]OGM30324.1 MAG: hypothetical protein A2873_05345 [Candidatus Woesebacteria bacterium RIFCSPHIGHO2_01_FULL_42_80]OGM34363.1 MAG: hypothetical protein A3D84_04925 [Candidatus Woesebacteria bacterium RIFCSPHIGHO2_02_FULL_42_20]OGM55497.1 MAG: hypothetical protein A3E44_01080 [Candidatus Woesebacteria bacterium RIFCSPHIGHO2_12_FULL_41